MITEKQELAFKVICKADHLALMECKNLQGKSVTVLCCAVSNDEGTQFTPLAQMFDLNPYEELTPPDMEDTDVPITETVQ